MVQENGGNRRPEVETDLRFGPFRLEATKRLWRGDRVVGIRPRPLAMLRYLAERPGRLVTKEELLKRLWPGIYVSSTVVKVCVREIRHALGDEATQPQFIATVGAQGYRFIGSSTATTGIVPGLKLQVSSSESQGPSAKPEPIPRPPFSIPHFVGREQELAQLQSWYERTQQGEQHIVFVSGEAGIGKTTLVNRFLAQLPAKRAVRIGYGHCVEQDEQGEVYLPVLQALQQICRAPDGDQVAAGLRRYAPLWLVQLSGVIEADELEAFQRQIQGSKPQRMLREFGEALGILAAETGLILVFEDLQWSDVSTLELLTYLAQRRERARLLVIGTYRPAETVTSGHPLRRVVQELVGRGQCRELILELFTEAEVESYLTERLERSPAAATLSSVVYRRTDGNALFVAHFMDYLVRRGLLVEAGGRWELRAEPTAIEGLIPDHVQRLIARQIEGLSKDEQQLLEVASVVGMTFTASEVARVVNRPLEVAEAMYDDLANQGQLIEIKGIAEWPDGVITVR
ncbi:MAG TPA: AAA family ATPase, partial [Candidatus Binatia bacterium]|nr:AAA family ATPase [Candidatus Binatia bacterium]